LITVFKNHNCYSKRPKNLVFKKTVKALVQAAQASCSSSRRTSGTRQDTKVDQYYFKGIESFI